MVFTFRCQQGDDDIGKCASKKETQQVNNQCGIIKDQKGVFETCITSLTNKGAEGDIIEVFEDCVFDACAAKNPAAREDSVCESVASFAETCGDAGNTTQWRKADFCRKCTTMEHYFQRKMRLILFTLSSIIIEFYSGREEKGINYSTFSFHSR